MSFVLYFKAIIQLRMHQPSFICLKTYTYYPGLRGRYWISTWQKDGTGWDR